MHPRDRRRYRLLGLSACVGALAAGCGASGPARAAAHGAASAGCRTRDVVVWLDTRGGGAAGSTYYRLEFTNQSQRACSLAGYPGVSAVDLRGHRLGEPASRNPARRPRTVVLAPGASAVATLRIADVDNFPRAVCRQTPAAGLRVYPPNNTSAKVVPFPFGACSRIGPVYLTVEAVAKPR